MGVADLLGGYWRCGNHSGHVQQRAGLLGYGRGGNHSGHGRCGPPRPRAAAGEPPRPMVAPEDHHGHVQPPGSILDSRGYAIDNYRRKPM